MSSSACRECGAETRHYPCSSCGYRPPGRAAAAALHRLEIKQRVIGTKNARIAELEQVVKELRASMGLDLGKVPGDWDGESERWLPVVGHEGHYEVSDLGRVRSVNRAIPQRHSSGDVAAIHSYQGRILRPVLNSGGYQKVNLSREGKKITRAVHRLVLEAFIGLAPDRQECLHGPGGAADERLSNLRWGTKVENMADKKRDGTHTAGESHPSSKLTLSQVLEIRADDRPHAEVAMDYGVTAGTISSIKSRRSWKHIPEEHGTPREAPADDKA